MKFFETPRIGSKSFSDEDALSDREKSAKEYTISERDDYLSEIKALEGKEQLTVQQMRRYSELRAILNDVHSAGEKNDKSIQYKENLGEKVSTGGYLSQKQKEILKKDVLTPVDIKALIASDDSDGNATSYENRRESTYGERMIELSLERSYSREEIRKIMEAISNAFLKKGEDFENVGVIIDNFEPDEKNQLMRSLNGDAKDIPQSFVSAYFKILNG